MSKDTLQGGMGEGGRMASHRLALGHNEGRNITVEEVEDEEKIAQKETNCLKDAFEGWSDEALVENQDC